MKVRIGWLFTDMRAEVVNVRSSRRKARIPVIGREGDIQQDLGSRSRQIVMRGSLYATGSMREPTLIPQLPSGFFDTAINTPNPHPIVMQQYLDMIWRLKWPVPFISDIAITLVTIDDTVWQIDSKQPHVYHYNIQLTEYSTPLSSVAVRAALARFAIDAELMVGTGGALAE